MLGLIIPKKRADKTIKEIGKYLHVQCVISTGGTVLKEDILRVLRAVRFASNLEFTLDDKTRYWSIKYGYLLKKLSGSRKKEELDKIIAEEKNRSKHIILSVIPVSILINLFLENTYHKILQIYVQNMH